MRPRLAALAGAVALGACGIVEMPSASDDPTPLAGTRWVAVIPGNSDPQTLPRMEFTAGGRMAGFTGCNAMSANYSESRGGVSFGAVAATKRYCVGPGGEIESRLLAILGPQANVTRKGRRLILSAPGVEEIEFVRAEAS